jgi:hypothetical protein
MLAAQIFKRDAILMGVHGFTSIWPEVERCRATLAWNGDSPPGAGLNAFGSPARRQACCHAVSVRRVEFVTRRFYRHDVKMNSQAANECACAK